MKSTTARSFVTACLAVAVFSGASASAALAGPRYDVSVANKTQHPVTLKVSDEKCMYTDGKSGSDLRPFNRTLSPGESVRNWVEGKASGGCFFESSYFRLTAHTTVNGKESTASRLWFVSSKANLGFHTHVAQPVPGLNQMPSGNSLNTVQPIALEWRTGALRGA